MCEALRLEVTRCVYKVLSPVPVPLIAHLPFLSENRGDPGGRIQLLLHNEIFRACSSHLHRCRTSLGLNVRIDLRSSFLAVNSEFHRLSVTE